MTRISNIGQNSLLQAQLMRGQERLAGFQRQIATGKVANTFADIPRQGETLLSARTMTARLQGYVDSNRQLATKLEIYNSTIGAVAGIADSLREDIVTAVDLNSGVALFDKLQNGFERMVSLLNTTFEGNYIFAGTRTDTAPVSVGTISELLALASPSDAFRNNDLKSQVKADETRTITFGVLADDLAGPLMTAFSRILEFNSGTLPSGAGAFAPAGAFSDPLTDNQRDFLIGELTSAATAIDSARAAEAANGINMATIDKVVARQEGELGFLRGFINDIEEIDVGEAITNLRAEEASLEATLQTIARITRISLLDFI